MPADPCMQVSTLPLQLLASPKFIKAILTRGFELQLKQVFEKGRVDTHARSNRVKGQPLGKGFSSGLVGLGLNPSRATTPFNLPPLSFIVILTELSVFFLKVQSQQVIEVIGEDVGKVNNAVIKGPSKTHGSEAPLCLNTEGNQSGGKSNNGDSNTGAVP